VDLGRKKLVFPPEVYATAQRPDLVLWSKKLHKVILVELTVPAEEGIEAAQLRKEARYLPLCDAINADKVNPWKASLFTVEAGARGFVAHTMRSFLRKLGLPGAKASSACKDISLIAMRCSYCIYLSRDTEAWDRSRDLLSVFVQPASATSTESSGVIQNPWKHRLTCLSFYGRACTCAPPLAQRPGR